VVTKLDMHLHTKGSDGTGSPNEFVKGIQKAGIDGVVLTDHHRTLTKEGLAVVKAVRDAGLIALVGCEYSTKEGHCLVFGVDVAKLGLGFYPTMQQLIDAVHERGGVAFPSHPYRGVKETLGDRIYQLSGLTHVEAFNGQNEAGNGWASSARPEANQKAVWVGEKMGLGQTGGSDAHQPDRIGTCFTEFSGNVRTVQALVEALKSKDHQAVVNRAMVDDQKRRAVVRQTWSPSPSSAQLRWWDDEDDFWRRSPSLDVPARPSYSRHETYEADPGYSGGLDDDDIPEHAYDEPSGSEDPEAVQAFLRAESRRQRRQRKPKHSRKRG
jgi:predicted metal-dependent phosphoesterase TrpH